MDGVVPADAHVPVTAVNSARFSTGIGGWSEYRILEKIVKLNANKGFGKRPDKNVRCVVYQSHRETIRLPLVRTDRTFEVECSN